MPRPRQPNPRPTRSCGRFRLLPQLSPTERRHLRRWIRQLPPAVAERLPRLRVRSAGEIVRVGQRVVFDTSVKAQGADRTAQAVSYINTRLVVLRRRLFRQHRLGQRLFYHELCHFLWPRLGTPRRRAFDRVLRRELRAGVRGELGYTAALCKQALGRRRSGAPWREYVCESFCDTGAYALLRATGVASRARSVEFTLGRRQRAARLWQWTRLLLPESAAARESGL